MRKVAPGLQTCPPLPPDCTFQCESLKRSRAELNAWLQNIMLYPAVKGSPAFHRFLMDGANNPPAYLDTQWAEGSGAAATGGYGRGAAEEDGDDMEMDELFDRCGTRFSAPGLHHCSAGAHFGKWDMIVGLTPLRAWTFVWDVLQQPYGEGRGIGGP